MIINSYSFNHVGRHGHILVHMKSWSPCLAYTVKNIKLITFYTQITFYMHEIVSKEYWTQELYGWLTVTVSFHMFTNCTVQVLTADSTHYNHRRSIVMHLSANISFKPGAHQLYFPKNFVTCPKALNN